MLNNPTESLILYYVNYIVQSYHWKVGVYFTNKRENMFLFAAIGYVNTEHWWWLYFKMKSLVILEHTLNYALCSKYISFSYFFFAIVNEENFSFFFFFIIACIHITMRFFFTNDKIDEKLCEICEFQHMYAVMIQESSPFWCIAFHRVLYF